MPIYIKKSTDAGFPPTIVASAGSLINLLDFLLVTTTGWTKEFSGTNTAVYRAPVGTNRFRLFVDDTSTTTARVIGYEDMTDAITGTGPFPTAAQVAGGLYVAKSVTTPWKFFSNGKIFYLFTQSTTIWNGLVFGDIQSDKAADSFGTVLISQATTGVTASALATLAVSAASTSIGHYMARPYTQIGSSVAVGKFSDAARSNAAVLMGLSGSSYPSPISGSLQLAPVWVGEGSAAGVRGLMPGLWNPLHSHPLADGDTFSGTGALAGRTFEAVCVQAVGSHQCFMETSDTWGGF